MIKKVYFVAWFLLIGSVLASVFDGTFSAVSLVVVSLVAATLVYAFALWAVTREVPVTG